MVSKTLRDFQRTGGELSDFFYSRLSSSKFLSPLRNQYQLYPCLPAEAVSDSIARPRPSPPRFGMNFHRMKPIFSFLSVLIFIICAITIAYNIGQIIQVLLDTNGPRDALHNTQSSARCCAQSWTMGEIDRRRSSVDCWQHLATIDMPSRNYS